MFATQTELNTRARDNASIDNSFAFSLSTRDGTITTYDQREAMIGFPEQDMYYKCTRA